MQTTSHDSEDDTNWYFISFRDQVTNRNLGCCNVGTHGKPSPESALEKTTKLGINPGGEALIFQIESPELEPNRLYSREEMMALDYRRIGE